MPRTRADPDTTLSIYREMPYDDQIVQAKQQGQIETLYKGHATRPGVAPAAPRRRAQGIRESRQKNGRRGRAGVTRTRPSRSTLPPLADAVHHRRAAVALGVHGTTPGRGSPGGTPAAGRQPARADARCPATSRCSSPRPWTRCAPARGAGYTERLSMVMDARSDRSSVLAATQSVSLLGDRRILEIKIPTGKPGKAGADTLARLAEQAEGQSDADTLVLISCHGWTRPRAKAAGSRRWPERMMVDIASIERGRLPACLACGWRARTSARQRHPAMDGRQGRGQPAGRPPGNPEAGPALSRGQRPQRTMERAVLNVARYDVFGLRDAMLAGDIARTIRMIDGLRAGARALPWCCGRSARKSACSRASPRPARWARTPTA